MGLRPIIILQGFKMGRSPNFNFQSIAHLHHTNISSYTIKIFYKYFLYSMVKGLEKNFGKKRIKKEKNKNKIYNW